MEDCIFAEIESNAIRYTWNAQPFTIRRCVFRDVRNVAIQGWADAEGPSGSIIERNLFLRIRVERGYGGSGYAGIILLFNDTEAEAWLPVPDGSWRLLDGSQARAMGLLMRTHLAGTQRRPTTIEQTTREHRGRMR